MEITFDIFNGIAFGIEYISKSEEDEIDESVIVVSILCFRAILWLND